jgi:phosphomannomutase
MPTLTCFKTYDVRGRLGAELNEGIARRIGRACVEALGARTVVVGRDCRASSETLMAACVEGLVAGGATVLDLGLCGTEEMYFAVTHFGADAGIEVTASHNPMDYNGMKLVRKGSAPLDSATGLAEIRKLVEGPDLPDLPRGCVIPAKGARSAYVARVLSFVDVAELQPMTILVNAGNGAAGPTFDAIAAELSARGAPLRFLRLHHEPDGSFPNGIPNPLLPENQPTTAEALVAAGADMGVAWDGDFDRCFLFDHLGRFIPGEYIVGLLAEVFLSKEPGATIIHDPRVVWNTCDVVTRAGGRAIQARTGHAFLKEAMRDTGAVYGGEMSAHHYFRDFMACDSGMIPWLLVAELIGRSGRSLADLVSNRMAAFPSSGEINFLHNDPAAAIARVEAEFVDQSLARDETDGLSLAFADWRLNLRPSNTEPLLRLNVEARGGVDLSRIVSELTGLIQATSENSIDSQSL